VSVPASAARLADLASAVGLEREPTPFLAIDLEVLERNVERMAAFFRGRQAGLRPHLKHHKCTEIASMQLAAGAEGLTCATTDEVAAAVEIGADVLLANVVLDPARLGALARAAARGAVTVAVDSAAAARALARALGAAGATAGVVVDIDVGMGRTGVQSMGEALAVAEEVAALPGLALRGVMAYEGHLVEIDDRPTRYEAAVRAFERGREVAEALRGRGFDATVLTGGSTATYDAAADAGLTDVQAGSYALMDADYVRLTPEFEPALALVATVLTSRPSGDVVVDAGSKRVGSDLGSPGLAGLDAVHSGTSEEHEQFRVRGGRPPRPGERVAVVPGHACTTMSLHCLAFGCRSGAFDRPLHIDARDPRA
jgi:D-serine deaminase-like pyridoxal phosphate-dependent protein